jgi:hypothetical protein
VTATDHSSARSRQVKVLVLDAKSLIPLMRGEVRVRNLPSDAVAVAAQVDLTSRSIGIRVHSQSFPTVDFGSPIPTMTAVVELNGGSSNGG